MTQKASALRHRYCVQTRSSISQCCVLITASYRNIALESLTVKLGEYFQIRDDYKNLTETVRDSAPSILRDVHVLISNSVLTVHRPKRLLRRHRRRQILKFSFPLIHALTSQPGDSELRALLQQSRSPGSIDVPTKQCILEHLHQAGSMEYTVKSLQGLMGEITGQIGLIENDTRCPNWILRLLVHRLAV